MLFDFISSWNVEYLSGGKCKHKDISDKNYYKTSPAGYSMINGWGSARYNTAAQLSALVYMKNHPERKDFGELAKGAMEYIMGRNPMGYSYIIGYGYEQGLPFAHHPHHRAAHGSKTNSLLQEEALEKYHLELSARLQLTKKMISHVIPILQSLVITKTLQLI